MNFRSQLLKTPDEFLKIRDEWNALTDRCSFPNFFLRAEWILAWWKWFGYKCGQFHCILVYENDRLIGGAPLFIEQNRTLKFLGYDGIACPEYLGIVVEEEKIESVSQVIIDYLSKNSDWSKLVFEDYALEDKGTVYFVSLLKHKFPTWATSGGPRFYIPLPFSTYDDYLKTRTQKNRKNKRRDLRIAIEKYDARLVELEVSDLDRWFPILQFLSRSSIGRKHFPPLMRTDFVGLYRELLTTLMPRKEARVFMFYYGDVPASFSAGFTYNGKFYYHQTGFDPAQPERPGSTVLQMVLAKLIEENFYELDFLRGEHEFKRFWTDSAHSTEFLIAFRNKNFSFYRTLFTEKVLRPVWRRGKKIYAQLGSKNRDAKK